MVDPARQAAAIDAAELGGVSVTTLGIDPANCSRIGRADDLASRLPHAGMPSVVPELAEALDPAAMDAELLRVIGAWPGLPQRTRRSILALVAATRQARPANQAAAKL